MALYLNRYRLLKQIAAQNQITYPTLLLSANKQLSINNIFQHLKPNLIINTFTNSKYSLLISKKLQHFPAS